MSLTEFKYSISAYTAIATQLIRHVRYQTGTVLYYVEAGDGYMDESIFVASNGSIDFIWPDDVELGYLIFDIWRMPPADKRWAAMEYVLRDGHFTTTFKFSGELNTEQSSSDRREAIARRIFGNKPIRYPPLQTSSQP